MLRFHTDKQNSLINFICLSASELTQKIKWNNPLKNNGLKESTKLVWCQRMQKQKQTKPTSLTHFTFFFYLGQILCDFFSKTEFLCRMKWKYFIWELTLCKNVKHYHFYRHHWIVAMHQPKISNRIQFYK